MDNVEILKTMKNELLQRVDALDYAIRILEASIPAAEPAKPKTRRKTKSAEAHEPGNALDMSKIPLYGGNGGGGIRLD